MGNPGYVVKHDRLKKKFEEQWDDGESDFVDLIAQHQNIYVHDGSNWMKKLLWYDAVCFLTIFGIVLWMNASISPEARELQDLVIWGKTMYALTAAPFIIFQIPVLSNILTHAKPTGYNRR